MKVCHLIVPLALYDQHIADVTLDTAGGLGRHLGVFTCTLLM